jgi:cell division septation protein DedD
MVSALASIALLPSTASGQSLHLAELFAKQGRIHDARAEVLAWFEIRGDEATPNEVQHGLWLRGRFARDPAAGVADLDRLIEEYPDGPYTVRALAWLAAAAAESGDDSRAAALYTRVAQSPTESEEAIGAREWLRQRGITVQRPVEKPEPRETPAPVRPSRLPADTLSAPADSAAPPPVVAMVDSISVETVDTLPSAAAETGEPVVPTAAVDSVTLAATETVDSVPVPSAAQVEAVAPPPAVEPEPEPERIPPGPPVPGAATAGSFAVQIGAFRNPVGAGGLVDELITAGFDARLVRVPANDLLRVRIGRFATLEEAQAELARVRAGGRDGAVVNDARRETQVR